MTYDELHQLYSPELIGLPGPGWWPMLEQLHAELTELGPFTTLQVKEKFGGLRVYLLGSHEQHELAYEYEHRSMSVCEQCSAPGELRSDGWWQTLCDGCVL